MKTIVAAAFVLSFCLSSVALAQPNVLPLQGVVTDVDGNPVSGAFAVTFNLYESENALLPVFGVTVDDVKVDKGIFSAELELGISDPFKDYPEVWLGVALEQLPELPRTRVGSVPYAHHSRYCDMLLYPVTDISCNGCIELDDLGFPVAGGESPGGSAVHALEADVAGDVVCAGCIDDEEITGLSYGKLNGAPESLPPSGPAGGVVSGTYPNPGLADGGGVRSLNGKTEHLTLTAGDNVTITPGDAGLTIAAGGGGSSVIKVVDGQNYKSADIEALDIV